MKIELHDDIFTAIKDRGVWAERQALWYKLRHQGLRRVNKPYPNAADLHFPLIDGHIDKTKPFYFQQLYTTEQFASFVSMRSQPAEFASAVAGWFDYRLKQKTNIEREIMCTIDFMCLGGRGIIKPAWAVEEKCICFDAIDPLYFIVPQNTQELKDADFCVHVILMSEREYKSNPSFRQDKQFVDSIKGRGTDTGGEQTDSKWQEVKRREGITYSTKDDQIIIWEIYRREGKDITVETYSPHRLQENDAVREKFALTYRHKKFPFISFRTEIKDKGWYSPRGIAEIEAAFEDSICMLWNGKHDCMDYYNNPLFKNEGDLSNTGVTRFLPGQTLPRGITPVQMPSPPIDFDQEIQNTRAIAEWRIDIPDLSIGQQHLAGRPGSRGDVTKAQIDAIVGQSGMSQDMRARVFRLDSAELFRMCWSLYVQYDKDSLMYLLNDEQLSVPPEALHGEYAIMPNGSADSWNKPFQMQKAVARMQLFGQSPFWDQAELQKSVMEIDDPRLIKRLYRDPGDKIGDQMEIQAQEISIMLLGFPAKAQAPDDPVAHLQSLQGYVDRSIQVGPQLTPEHARLFLQHGAEHDQQMQEKKIKEIGQVRQQMAPMIQYLGDLAQQDQAQNVIPMGGAASQGMTAASGAASAPKDPVDAAKDVQDSATKLITALSGAISKGVPITPEQLNDAFVQAGLPPLPPGSPAKIEPPQPERPPQSQQQ